MINECEKCSMVDIEVTYVEKGAFITSSSPKRVETEFVTSSEYDCYFKLTANKEHLHKLCKSCEYVWREGIQENEIKTDNTQTRANQDRRIAELENDLYWRKKNIRQLELLLADSEDVIADQLIRIKGAANLESANKYLIEKNNRTGDAYAKCELAVTYLNREIDDLEQQLYSQNDIIAKFIHYPECWDTMAYPELKDAVNEFSHCSSCHKPIKVKGKEND